MIAISQQILLADEEVMVRIKLPELQEHQHRIWKSQVRLECQSRVFLVKSVRQGPVSKRMFGKVIGISE